METILERFYERGITVHDIMTNNANVHNSTMLVETLSMPAYRYFAVLPLLDNNPADDEACDDEQRAPKRHTGGRAAGAGGGEQGLRQQCHWR